MDAVQSSKFITGKKSAELIRKLGDQTSKYHASALNHQVFVAGRVKTMNESIYYNVDLIHTAISEDVKVRFRYYMWDENKKQVYKRDGAYYSVSPWGLTWVEENYYLIGFDDEYESIRYYRVDKMKNIGLADEKREGREEYGLPEPEFVDIETALRINLYRALSDSGNSTDQETNQETSLEMIKSHSSCENIINEISSNPFITQIKLAERTGMSRSGVKYVLKQLQNEGLLE